MKHLLLLKILPLSIICEGLLLGTLMQLIEREDGQVEFTWWPGKEHSASTLDRLFDTAKSDGDRNAPASSSSDEDSPEEINEAILFARFSRNPYVCCGRVSYARHEDNPMK